LIGPFGSSPQDLVNQGVVLLFALASCTTLLYS